MSGSVNKAPQKLCARCGEPFDKNQTTSRKAWAARKYCSRECASQKITTPISEIVEKFEGGALCSEIADELGCTVTHVARLVRNATGSTRPRSEAMRISHNRPHVKRTLSKAFKGRTLPDSAKDALRQRTGPLNHNWGGGITECGGYKYYTASPSNGENARRAVHRVIMENLLGRKLRPDEHVHHIDGNKKNNSISNLVALSASEHAKLHTNDREEGKNKCQAR